MIIGLSLIGALWHNDNSIVYNVHGKEFYCTGSSTSNNSICVSLSLDTEAEDSLPGSITNCNNTAAAKAAAIYASSDLASLNTGNTLTVAFLIHLMAPAFYCGLTTWLF